MARWINVSRPFDYHWPGRSAVTAFREEHTGDQFVKDEVADFAVAKGYATEGKRDGSSRSKKGAGKRARKGKNPAKTADTGPADIVGDEDAADADRPADVSAVDDAAG